jgi:hypothetical protein
MEFFWLLCQICAAGLFLASKIGFSMAERQQGLTKDAYLIGAWAVYLLGIPFWVAIFVHEDDWIAAALEAGGIPILLLGLVLAIGRGRATLHPKLQKTVERLVHALAVIAVIGGLALSVYTFGNVALLNQWLEIGTVVGFLVGSYLLARRYPSGYLLYVLMHICMGWLMWRQDYLWLALQQVASLVFVGDAYYQWCQRNLCPECGAYFSEDNKRTADGMCQVCADVDAL